MDPVKTCSQVLEHIRHTNLNFVFSESPFGVNISIKKSFSPAHSSVRVDMQENSDTKVNVATEKAMIRKKQMQDLSHGNQRPQM